jgi:hypothetical protein
MWRSRNASGSWAARPWNLWVHSRLEKSPLCLSLGFMSLRFVSDLRREMRVRRENHRVKIDCKPLQKPSLAFRALCCRNLLRSDPLYSCNAALIMISVRARSMQNGAWLELTWPATQGATCRKRKKRARSDAWTSKVTRPCSDGRMPSTACQSTRFVEASTITTVAGIRGRTWRTP